MFFRETGLSTLVSSDYGYQRPWTDPGWRCAAPRMCEEKGALVVNMESSTSRYRILIVDDEPSLRRILGVTLTALGFDTELAGTGEQALSLLGTSQYDLVLLDVEMPGIGGIETCRRIRGLSRRPAVVMLTVSDSEEYEIRALAAGADDYIRQPCRVRDLVGRIRAVLGKRRSDEQSEESQ